jgi:hypothetical protein
MSVMSQDPGGILTSTWAQGGAILVLVGALLWLAWSSITRERRRADEQDAWIRTEAFPAVIEATKALTRATDVLASVGSRRS